jgi:hypothetical protein
MSSRLVITLREANRKPRDVSVDADRALIGSAAHCEVQLAQEDAAPEHLMLEVRNGAVMGRARYLRPEPLLNGAPFVEGRILPDSVVRIGSVEMTIGVGVADGGTAARKSTGSRSRVLALALLAMAGTMYVYTMNERRVTPIASAPDPLALWETTEDDSCPRHDTEVAVAAAENLRLAASGKRERSPFSPLDGVAAVPLYRRAAACLTLAGRGNDAQEASFDAERLRAKMDDEYRIHRVGLERTLIDQDWEGARKHIHVLLSFLGGRSGKYVEWLSNADRRLQLKVGSAKTPVFGNVGKRAE